MAVFEIENSYFDQSTGQFTVEIDAGEDKIKKTGVKVTKGSNDVHVPSDVTVVSASQDPPSSGFGVHEDNYYLRIDSEIDNSVPDVDPLVVGSVAFYEPEPGDTDTDYVDVVSYDSKNNQTKDVRRRRAIVRNGGGIKGVL